METIFWLSKQEWPHHKNHFRGQIGGAGAELEKEKRNGAVNGSLAYLLCSLIFQMQGMGGGDEACRHCHQLHGPTFGTPPEVPRDLKTGPVRKHE